MELLKWILKNWCTKSYLLAYAMSLTIYLGIILPDNAGYPIDVVIYWAALAVNTCFVIGTTIHANEAFKEEVK